MKRIHVKIDEELKDFKKKDILYELKHEIMFSSKRLLLILTPNHIDAPYTLMN
jgi:hypothetical protein